MESKRKKDISIDLLIYRDLLSIQGQAKVNLHHRRIRNLQVKNMIRRQNERVKGLYTKMRRLKNLKKISEFVIAHENLKGMIVHGKIQALPKKQRKKSRREMSLAKMKA